VKIGGTPENKSNSTHTPPSTFTVTLLVLSTYLNGYLTGRNLWTWVKNSKSTLDLGENHFGHRGRVRIEETGEYMVKLVVTTFENLT